MKDYDTNILNILQAAVYIRDLDKNLVYINPVAEKISGFSLKQAQRLKCYEVFGDAEQDCRRTCPVDVAIESQTPLVHLEGALCNRGGQKINMSVSISPIVEDEERKGALVLLEDIRNFAIIEKTHIKTIISLEKEIARREKAEAALRREKQLFTSGPVITFQLRNSPGWPVEYVSENISQFGYTPQEILSGQIVFSDLIFKDDLERVAEEVERFGQNELSIFEQEYRIVKKDGEVIWVNDFTRIIRDLEGIITNYDGYLLDITEKKEAREGILKSQKMLHMVVNNIPQAIFWKDVEGCFLGCNSVFASVLGYDEPGKLIGLSDFDLPIPREEAEAYRIDDKQVLETRKAKLHLVESFHQADGKQIWIETSKAPLIDEAEHLFGVLGIFTDITQRKAMEEALEKRILALTRPLDDSKGLEFEDLFNIELIQQLQDEFAKATGVASVIIASDGTLITKPGNVRGFCPDIAKNTEFGRILNHYTRQEPAELRVRMEGALRPCLNSGLWEAGASIAVGGKHLATWFIGLTRDESLTEADLTEFVREKCTDQRKFVEAFFEFPSMSAEQFGHIARVAVTLTKQLSNIAYQNVQQARYITDRRLAVEALYISREEINESRTMLSIALALARMGHWEMDLKTLRFTFNDQFYELYATNAEREGGYLMPAEVYAGEFFFPEDAWILQHETEQTLLSKEENYQRQLEHRIIRRDGEVRHIVVRYKLIRNSRGEPSKIIGANQDITDRKMVEESWLTAKREAEDANQAKSVFLANMSHEIRTPLNGLMGMLQLMQTRNSQPALRDYIDISLQSCKRLTNLLTDILDLSRVEAGKMQIKPEPFNFRGNLEAIALLFEPTAMAKGLTLKFTVDPSIPERVVGDSVRLQQIISNLVGNAIKFTAKGAILVEACLLKSEKKEECRILYSVSDSGIGISDEALPRLFNPFVQLESGDSREYQGAGLGLVISKRLAELMGGSLAVISETGVGSTFYCNIPMHYAKTSALGGVFVAGGKLPEDLKVLLAEDDEISRMVAKSLLEKFNYTVHTVENGEKALLKLKEEPYDLLILDIQMPVLGGPETARAIRQGMAGEGKRTIPIIALTACAMDGDMEKFMAAGMDGYVGKPVDIQELKDALCRVFAQSSFTTS